tara:strand:+ start:1346 stop:1870 length:525 start_codon:yes stop_codon:yes gene_type:complete
MIRDYDTGKAKDVIFFTGIEVEKTPAFGMKTLFVTGVQDYYAIRQKYISEECTHIFFGANHSYNPDNYEDFNQWDALITLFLKDDILCSLDIPSTIDLESFLDGGLTEYNNFIPQIRVVIPYIKQWGYNTMVKIDDKGFKASNPGVWCHSLHDLMDRDKFTDWTKYTKDSPINH